MKSFVEERFGHTKWTELTQMVKADEVPENHHHIDDKLALNLLDALPSVTKLERDAVLELLGTHYIRFLRKSGHDELFKTLGETLQQFVENLDYIHAAVKTNYPDIDAPSFRCDEASEADDIVLHYYSIRKGLYPMVQGMVKEIAGVFYNKSVGVKVRSITIEAFSETTSREHVIFDVHTLKCQKQDAEDIPTFVAQTKRQGERQILQQDVEKVKARLEQIRIERGEEYLPLNKGAKANARWRRIMNVRKLYKGFTASYPTEFYMNTNTFCDNVSPFHVVFNKEMTIIQSGTQLQKLMPITKELGGKANVTDCFTLIHPLHMDFTFENIRKLIRCLFVVETKAAMMHSEYGENPPLRLKGQMVYMEEFDVICYLCSPIVFTFKDLEERAMHLSDIPIHDVTRDMLLRGVVAKQGHQHSDRSDSLGTEADVANGESSTLGTNDTSVASDSYPLLPKSIVDRLRDGEKFNGATYENVTVLFCNIIMFSEIVENCKPTDVIKMLNTLHDKFDTLVKFHDVLRVETSGDAYIMVSGVPDKVATHAERICNVGLGLVTAANEVSSPLPTGSLHSKHVTVRVGIDTGEVVAGLVGSPWPRLMVMGDAVATASNMECHGVEDRVQISSRTYQAIKDANYTVEERGEIETKGHGQVMTYLLVRNESVSLDEIMGRPAKGTDSGTLQFPRPVSRQGSASSRESDDMVAP